MAQGDMESLKRDLDTIRTERDNALQQVERSAASQRQAEAVRLHNFIGALPPPPVHCHQAPRPPVHATRVRQRRAQCGANLV